MWAFRLESDLVMHDAKKYLCTSHLQIYATGSISEHLGIYICKVFFFFDLYVCLSIVFPTCFLECGPIP